MELKRLGFLAAGWLAACGSSATTASTTSAASALDAAVGVDTTQTPEKCGKGFEMQDKNGDGVLTEDEVPADVWARISPADADGNAQLTKDEIEAAIAAGTISPPPHGRGHGRGEHGPGGPSGAGGPPDHGGDPFTRDDKNADGFITSDEVPADLWTWLSQADADGDGQVSKDEIDAAKAAGNLPPPPRPEGGDRDGDRPRGDRPPPQ